MVQIRECLNTSSHLDLTQFYVNRTETFANSRCNPETQQRALGISVSRTFRAAPGLCPELVVLPRSKCPLPNLVLSLGHPTLYFHIQCASSPWFPRPSATGELTRSIWFPCKVLKYFRCNEINLKKMTALPNPFPLIITWILFSGWFAEIKTSLPPSYPNLCLWN